MKTKALISFVITAKLICIFVFAYVDCWFSHEAAHLIYFQGKYADIENEIKINKGFLYVYHNHLPTLKSSETLKENTGFLNCGAWSLIPITETISFNFVDFDVGVP